MHHVICLRTLTGLYAVLGATSPTSSFATNLVVAGGGGSNSTMLTISFGNGGQGRLPPCEIIAHYINIDLQKCITCSCSQGADPSQQWGQTQHELSPYCSCCMNNMAAVHAVFA